MFKLLIECTKDIDTLQINFSDGTSVVTSKDDNQEKSHKSTKSIKNNETKKDYLNTDEDFSVKQEIIQKPDIPDINRPPKVSDELQNLDF